MKIKVIDGKPQYLGKQFCYVNVPTYVDDVFENEVEEAVDRNIALEIFTDKWITGKEYFANQEKTEDKVDEQEEKVVDAKENSDDSIPYEEIFSGHWTKQVQKVEEYDNSETVSQLLEYAESNDVSDGVIKRIKEHLESL